jgi:hypothetical protein
MAISISKTDVKRKCQIAASEATYDTSIDSLIAEMLPAIEYTIADVYLNDINDTKLQATLKLGILETICGEFLQQLTRELGNEQFSAGGITVGEMKDRSPALIQQGASRLTPFLKGLQPMMSETIISSTTQDTDPTFNQKDVESDL